MLLCSRASVHTLLMVDSDYGLVLSLFQWQRTTRETKSAFFSTLRLLKVEFMPFEPLSLPLQTWSCTSFWLQPLIILVLLTNSNLTNVVKYQIGLKMFVSANIWDPIAFPCFCLIFKVVVYFWIFHGINERN